MTFSGGFGRAFRPAFDPGRTDNGLLNNLVAYWPLNEAGGANNALDMHSNGMTLTQVNSPAANTGKVYGTAREFTSSHYFTRSSEALLQIGNTSLVFSAWVYWTGANNKGIVAKTNGIDNNEYTLYVYSSSSPYYARFMFRDAANSANYTVSASESLPVNTWTLVNAWYDHGGGTSHIQINNGTVYTNNCGSVGVWASTKQFRLGHYWTGTEWWVGRLGPVAMWKGGVLTAAQRTTLYNSGAGLAYANFTR